MTLLRDNLTPSMDSAAMVPPLESGDRLSRAEFERRYHAMAGLKKAELIGGIVHMPSPVRIESHGNPHFRAIGWLSLYESNTPGVIGADNSTVRLPGDEEPQPDVCLLIHPSLGGQCCIGKDDYIEGAPELIMEIAASSVSYDLFNKLEVYGRTGVREYLVWRVLDRQIDWFVIRDRRYEPLETGDDGIYRSEAFPGLWLDAAAMVGGQMTQVMSVLQAGLESDAHREFARRLLAAIGE